VNTAKKSITIKVLTALLKTKMSGNIFYASNGDLQKSKINKGEVMLYEGTKKIIGCIYYYCGDCMRDMPKRV